MKKKLVNNIAFFTLLITIIVALGHVMTPQFMVKYHLANTKAGVVTLLQAEAKDSLDVLVVGDSESYTSVSPVQLWEKYGVTSYAAGQIAARLSESRDILAAAMETQSPTVVLLETNSLYRNDKKDDSLQGKISECISDHCTLIKQHDCWKSPIHKASNNYKGFWINYDVVPCDVSNYMTPTDQKEPICQENLDTLHEMEEICKKNGAELVLYSAPSPVNYNYAKHNALAELAEKEGLSYFDLNLCSEEMAIDWNTDSRDGGDHLNSAGAEKTTDYIGQYLMNHYSLKDRRNMKIAKSWNSLVDEYNAKSERAIQIITGKREANQQTAMK